MLVNFVINRYICFLKPFSTWSLSWFVVMYVCSNCSLIVMKDSGIIQAKAFRKSRSEFLGLIAKSFWQRSACGIGNVKCAEHFFFTFWWTHAILWATDNPVLNFWWHLLWVEKPEWAALFALGKGICDICSLRFISNVTPAGLLMGSMAAGNFSHMRLSAEVGCLIRLGDLPHAQNTYYLLFEYNTFGKHRTRS